MRTLFALLTVILLSGCSNFSYFKDRSVPIGEPPTRQDSPVKHMMSAVPPIEGKKITIAVYGFTDKTGQRKPNDRIANLSSAVTQGAEVWVIQGLQTVGNEGWFEVVERIGMDHLIKERQLIRNTREVYEKEIKRSISSWFMYFLPPPECLLLSPLLTRKEAVHQNLSLERT